MKTTNRMMLAFAFTDIARARQLAQDINGALLEDVRAADGPVEGLPFQALVCGATDQAEAFGDVADVGAYLVCERTVKVRPKVQSGEQPGVVGVFTMVARSSLGHAQADAHWRDVHAPLALSAHVAMTNYRQLSVVHTFHGPAWDGFALCGFDSLDDLRERFFVSEAYQRQIQDDVRQFADGRKSPRRVIAREVRYQ